MDGREAQPIPADGGADESAFPDRTLRGNDSRLPPQTELGASARTEASVSMLRLRRLDEDASVMMLALSLRRPWAVAEEYVLGAESCMWRGMAEMVFAVDGAGETGY